MLVAIIVFICFSFIYAVNPVIIDTVEIKARSLATKAMNTAIGDAVGLNFTYDDIIKINYDNYGNVSLIQANSISINNFTQNLAINTEKLICKNSPYNFQKEEKSEGNDLEDITTYLKARVIKTIW